MKNFILGLFLIAFVLGGVLGSDDQQTSDNSTDSTVTTASFDPGVPGS